jgi:hypothetical protein
MCWQNSCTEPESAGRTFLRFTSNWLIYSRTTKCEHLTGYWFSAYFGLLWQFILRLVFWDVTLYNLVDRYKCLARTCCHQQGKGRTPTLKMAAADSSKIYIPIYWSTQYRITMDYNFNISVVYLWGTWWCSWLRHCSTSQKVADSITGDVVEIFHWHNPSGHTMALGLTQSPTEMSTRSISWGLNMACAQG